MKKLFIIFLLITLLTIFSLVANAQISVSIAGYTNTTPNLALSYTSLSSALTDLNAVTAMTGPVILTCNGPSSETTPPTGLTVGSASLNLVLNSTNTITINTTGGTVTLNAGVGTSTPGSAAPDGILKLVGADFVTIDGLAFTDGNITNPATMEFGIALFKRGAGDGCNYNTIKNCSINMQRVNNASGTSPMIEGSVGILVINSISTAATTVLTPTNGGTLATNGTNSNNKLYTNIISGGNYGIGFSGYSASFGVGPSPTPNTFLGDLSNDIGGSASGQGNQILNFGGAASAANPSAGIRANNQWSINISYNILNNNNGGGVNHVNTLRGIYAQAGTSANVTISYNTVTLSGGGTTTQISAIENAIGTTAASNTVNLNNNNITDCSYSTGTLGTFYCIYNSATAGTVNINNNIVQNSTYTGAITSGNFLGIVNSAIEILSINTNTINNLTIGGTGDSYCIGVGSPARTGCTVNGNTITNITRTGASGTQRAIIMTDPTNNITFNNNTIDGINWTTVTSTGNIDGIYGFTNSTNITISNNIIRNLSTPTTGIINGIREKGLTGTKIIQNNQIYNFSTYPGGAGGASFYGIYCTTGNIEVSGSLIYGLNSSGTTGGTIGSIIGIYISGGITNNIFKNKVYNLSSTSTGPLVSGIVIGGGTTNTIYNNLISNLTAPAADRVEAIRGINITSTSSSSSHNISFNTVYLSASSTGANFGTYGIYHTSSETSTTSALNLRNNIIVNKSTASGTGLTVVYRRSAGTGGMLSNYAITSNYNLFYAGTPDTKHLIFYDGTNYDQALASYKTRVSPRDVFSLSADPGFTSESDLTPNVYNPNCWNINGGAYPIANVTTDINGVSRNTAVTSGPEDIGAYKFTPAVEPNNLVVTGSIANGSVSTLTFAGTTIATIKWHSGAGTLPTSISAIFKPGNIPPGTLVNTYAYEYLDISQTGGILPYTYDVTLYYNLARSYNINISSENNIRVAKYTSGNWAGLLTNTTTNITNKTVTITGINNGFSSFTFTGNDAPLPVQIASFTANVEAKRDVKLSWTTATENNNVGFEIERKLAVDNSWTKVGYVTGGGTKNTSSNYSFDDRKLNTGKYNYRLKQIDYNGNFEFFNLAGEIEIGVPKKFDVSQNYPNPFNPVAKIDFDLPFDSKVSMKLYDISGREVMTLVNEQKPAGYYTVQFNGNNLSSGMYFYRIIAEGNGQKYVMTKKAMLIK